MGWLTMARSVSNVDFGVTLENGDSVKVAHFFETGPQVVQTLPITT
jgi:hypothetical protein